MKPDITPTLTSREDTPRADRTATLFTFLFGACIGLFWAGLAALFHLGVISIWIGVFAGIISAFIYCVLVSGAEDDR